MSVPSGRLDKKQVAQRVNVPKFLCSVAASKVPKPSWTSALVGSDTFMSGVAMKGCDVVADVQRTLFHNANCFDAWPHKQRVDAQSNLRDVEVTSREPDVTVTTQHC